MEIHQYLLALVDSVDIDGKVMKIMPRIFYDILTLVIMGSVVASILTFIIYLFV